MIAAIVLTVLLALLAAFQIALIAGAPWGRFAWGGQERVLSTRRRWGSAVSIVIYAVIALIALDRVGIVALIPDPLAVVCAWVVFGYFCLGIVLNAISRSKPERYTMTPITLILAVLSLLVAVS